MFGKQNYKETFLFVLFTACMLTLGACGKAEENGAKETSLNQEAEKQTSDVQETVIQEGVIQESAVVEEADLAEAEEIKDGESGETQEAEDAAADDVSDEEGLLECERITCGRYDLDGDNKYVMVSAYDDDDSGECMLTFGWEGMYGADNSEPLDEIFGVYFDLKNIEGDTYSATYDTTAWGGECVSVTVTFTDGGMDLTGATGALEGYNGHYTWDVESNDFF